MPKITPKETNEKLAKDMGCTFLFREKGGRVTLRCDRCQEISVWPKMCQIRGKTGCLPCNIKIRGESYAQKCANSNPLTAEKYPQLFTEYHSDNIKPLSFYSQKSSQKVKWKCENGHIWEALISNRTNGSNCPLCSQRERGKLYRAFRAKENPVLDIKIKLEYDPSNFWKIEQLSNSSKERVLWRCLVDQTHSWEATVSQRTSTKSGCPICCAGKRKSQKSLFEYLLKIWPEAIYEARVLKSNGLTDIYIPSQNLAIEMDSPWHDNENSVKRDRKKDERYLLQGVSVFRVRWEDFIQDPQVLVKRLQQEASKITTSIRKKISLGFPLNEISGRKLAQLSNSPYAVSV